MPAPAPHRVIRLLKDGYWDRTEVLEMPDGSQRVRKRNRADVESSPWGLESLRREIHYLAAIADRPAAAFPPLLDHWDQLTPSGRPDIGYDHPYYAKHRDAGQIARVGRVDQAEVDHFQDHLAAALLQEVHIPQAAPSPLSAHLQQAVTEAFTTLRQIPCLQRLIDTPQIRLNGHLALGPATVWQEITQHSSLLTVLDQAPHTRIHGDFFLENILWTSRPPSDTRSLILIDPVSVAGVSVAPPVFDLVKYTSYAKGELLALRSEWLTVAGFEPPSGPVAIPAYAYQLDYAHPQLAALRTLNWHSRFRAAFLAHHGPIDQRLYHLIDGYFSAAMAANTTGTQQQARLLKAVFEFNAALAV